LDLGEADVDMDLFFLREALLDLFFCASQHERFEDFVQLLDHFDVLLLFLLFWHFAVVAVLEPLVEELGGVEDVG
jgi:hypothetical protein